MLARMRRRYAAPLLRCRRRPRRERRVWPDAAAMFCATRRVYAEMTPAC